MGFLQNAINKVSGWLNGNVARPVGDTWRGIGADWFNASAVAREDWQRAEQSADNALARDLTLQKQANEATSAENQLAREWNAQREDTYYQRMVEDMKTAGINPIMAISGGGADISPSPSFTASNARSSGSNYSGSSAGGNGLGAIASVLAGLITKGKSNGTTLSQTFNKHGELVRSTINSRR